MLDIFNNSAFTVTSLTDTINQVKFQPGFLGSLGLFRSSGVSTLSIGIEEKGGLLSLVAPTPRGGVGVPIDKRKRTMRNLTIPHFEIPGAVYADEVQGVRAYGSETELETVMGKVAEHIGDTMPFFDATTEYSQIGAAKGIVTYADGTTLNLFTEFGVTQPAEVAWDIVNTVGGAMRKRCATLYRQVAGILDGLTFSDILVLCSDQFYDDLISNTEIRSTYLQQQEANVLRTGYVNNGQTGSFGSFRFGDITFVNYRGQVGATKFVADDKAHVIPLGVQNLFRTYWAPADYTETVNTVGKRLYAKQWEMDNGKGINFDFQMNELNICTRPAVLIPLRRGV